MSTPLRLVHLTPEEDQDLKRIEFNPKLSEKVRLRALIRVLVKTRAVCKIKKPAVKDAGNAIWISSEERHRFLIFKEPYVGKCYI